MVMRMTEEDWEDINSLLASGEVTDKIRALKKILEAAGIEFQDPKGGDWLSVTLGETTFTVQFAHLPDSYTIYIWMERQINGSGLFGLVKPVKYSCCLLECFDY